MSSLKPVPCTRYESTHTTHIAITRPSKKMYAVKIESPPAAHARNTNRGARG